MEGVTLPMVTSVVAAVATLGNIALAALLWRMRGEFATHRDMEKEREKRVAAESGLTASVGALGQRMGQLEAAVKVLPDAEALHELALAMERLNGELKVTNANLGATNERLDTCQTTLDRHESIFADAAQADRRRGK